MSDTFIRRYLDLISTRDRSYITRRSFLKGHAAFFLGATLASSGIVVPSRSGAQPAQDIAAVTGRPAQATRVAVEILGGMGAFVKRGQKVVIKPNMSFAGTIEDGVATHPEVVREIVAMCGEAGAARIRVLDHPLRPAERCVAGIRNACRPYGESLVHGLEERSFYREVDIGRGVSLTRAEVMRDVLEADVLIAVPVAKSHGSTGVSLSMKGMMG
ncbi:MAG TPA: DUF362 domain-containing protein, partial [Deltaproteobacteria bacterium]|nr:DUF362 domain-containing protein [Deltaproteobacteria bacterium]